MATATATAERKGGSLRDLADARSGEIFFVNPEKVVLEEGFNVRDFSTKENRDHIEFLAKSILENGQEEPGTVRVEDGKIILVNGECRLRAIRNLIAKGHEIRGFKVQADTSKRSEPDRIASLISRNSGKTLAPLEQSAVITRLKRYGWTDTQIAQKVGLSQPYVSQLLTLSAAPEQVKAMVAKGQVSATQAVATVKEHGDEAASILSDSIAEAALKTGRERATARHIENVKSRKNTTAAPVWTQRSVVKVLITALAEIATDTSLGLKPTQSVRGIARDALENADVDARAWLKEYGDVAEEDE